MILQKKYAVATKDVTKKINNCGCEISQKESRSLCICSHFLKVFVRYPDADPNKGPKHVVVFY